MEADKRFADSPSRTSLVGRDGLSPLNDRALLRRLSELSEISESGRLAGRSAAAEAKGATGTGIVLSPGEETGSSEDIRTAPPELPAGGR